MVDGGNGRSSQGKIDGQEMKKVETTMSLRENEEEQDKIQNNP